MGKTREEIFQDIFDFCDKNNIFWFCDIAHYAAENKKSWFHTIASDYGGIIVSDYLAKKAFAAGMITPEQYAKHLDDTGRYWTDLLDKTRNYSLRDKYFKEYLEFEKTRREFQRSKA